MYVPRLTFGLSLVIIACSALTHGFAEEPTADERAAVPKDKILVHLNGSLVTAWKQEKDLNGGKPIVLYAALNAGGTQVVLDWNGCPEIHDELAAFHVGGSIASGIFAEVTGEMVFRPRNQLTKNPVDNVKRSGDELCPVVIVETLHIRVEPLIPSRERKLVRSTTYGTRKPSTE